MIHNKFRTGKDLMTVMEKSLELEPKSRKKVGKYSMGVRQRLAIGQAISWKKSGNTYS